MKTLLKKTLVGCYFKWPLKVMAFWFYFFMTILIIAWNYRKPNKNQLPQTAVKCTVFLMIIRTFFIGCFFLLYFFLNFFFFFFLNFIFFKEQFQVYNTIERKGQRFPICPLGLHMRSLPPYQHHSLEWCIFTRDKPTFSSVQFSSVQSLIRVRLFATP